MLKTHSLGRACLLMSCDIHLGNKEVSFASSTGQAFLPWIVIVTQPTGTWQAFLPCNCKACSNRTCSSHLLQVKEPAAQLFSDLPYACRDVSNAIRYEQDEVCNGAGSARLISHFIDGAEALRRAVRLQQSLQPATLGQSYKAGQVLLDPISIHIWEFFKHAAEPHCCRHHLWNFECRGTFSLSLLPGHAGWPLCHASLGICIRTIIRVPKPWIDRLTCSIEVAEGILRPG